MDRITFSATDCNTNETISVWLQYYSLLSILAFSNLLKLLNST